MLFALNEVRCDKKTSAFKHAVNLGKDFHRVRHDMKRIRNDNNVERFIAITQISGIGYFKSYVCWNSAFFCQKEKNP